MAVGRLVAAQEGERVGVREIHRRGLEAEQGVGGIEAGFGENLAEARDALAARTHARIGGQQGDAPMAEADQIAGRRPGAGAMVDQDRRPAADRYPAPADRDRG